MTRPNLQRFAHVSLLILLLGLTFPVFAQTRVKPGMNFFSIKQDVELGRQAAQESEQHLPILNDPESNDYIVDLGRKLARNTDMPDLPWQFKMVNASDVNAFALPGGFVYVNRGLIEAAETEGELVGVLCHEISHVTLRHGTNQVSKAMLAQAPLSILGGTIGEKGILGQLAQLGIGVGANLTFMKFSRTAESQADLVGVQLMARSGYDPGEMVRMFQMLEGLGKGEPTKIEQWFLSHPTPENRIGRLRQEIAQIKRSPNPIQNLPRFNTVRNHLRALPPAPKAKAQQPSGGPSGSGGKPEPPSNTMTTYRHPQRLYTLAYPSNWKVAGGGTGVVFAPEGGIESVGNQSHIVYGALINLFEPHDRSGTRRARTLREAVDDLVDHLIQGNPYLSPAGERKADRLAGAEAIRVRLSGQPKGGRTEVVELIARGHEKELIYIAFIAPEEEFKIYEPTLREMARSMRVGE